MAGLLDTTCSQKTFRHRDVFVRILDRLQCVVVAAVIGLAVYLASTGPIFAIVTYLQPRSPWRNEIATLVMHLYRPATSLARSVGAGRLLWRYADLCGDDARRSTLRRKYAVPFVNEARSQLNRGEFGSAKRLAMVAGEFDAAYELFDDEPKAILSEIDHLQTE